MTTEVDTMAAESAAPRAAAKKQRPKWEDEEAQLFVASQWLLMWWKFRRHRLAMVSTVVTILLYLTAAFAGFVAPFEPTKHQAKFTYAPPQFLHFFRTTEDGLKIGPYVYGYKMTVDAESLRRDFVINKEEIIPIQFFAKGTEYKLLGLFPTDVHLFGPEDPEQRFYLLGADRMGRDLFSRLIHGARISLSIGLVGVFLSLFLGVLIGGFSGYIGGALDNAIQRIIEFLQSIPTIPLWMGLSAALPPDWTPIMIYFAITIILSLRGWTGMARVVRGRFLSLREEDFVLAARLDGASQTRIILRHMAPSFMSHIIASVTLSIPGMILSETSLSFLGLGLRPPIVSWGVLLKESQNVRTVAQAPWLLLPGLAVVIAVLALNFVGDGLRDAADPYAQ
jgi:peptide/nickel transport system permease protein